MTVPEGALTTQRKFIPRVELSPKLLIAAVVDRPIAHRMQIFERAREVGRRWGEAQETSRDGTGLVMAPLPARKRGVPHCGGRFREREMVYVPRERHVVVEDKDFVELGERERADLAKRQPVVLVCPSGRLDGMPDSDVHTQLLQRHLLLEIALRADDDMDGQPGLDAPGRLDKPPDARTLR